MTTQSEIESAAALLGRLGGLKGGRSKSPKKAAASRANGKLGGRPVEKKAKKVGAR